MLVVYLRLPTFPTIRANLEKKGTPIGSYDVLMAGTAKACSVILVARNTRESKRVQGLALQNWH